MCLCVPVCARVCPRPAARLATHPATCWRQQATARGTGGTTIITNYPTHEAMALSSGGMTERGLALKDFKSWSQKKCGLDHGPCLLAFHTDHGTGQAFVPTLCTFLLGVYEQVAITITCDSRSSSALSLFLCPPPKLFVSLLGEGDVSSLSGLRYR